MAKPKKTEKLPLWLRVSLTWGGALVWVVDRLGWLLRPLFTRHYHRTRELWWAAIFAEPGSASLVDGWDQRARHAWLRVHNPGYIEWERAALEAQREGRLVPLEPRPGSAEAFAVEVRADFHEQD